MDNPAVLHIGPDDRFVSIASDILGRGGCLEIAITGRSMLPFLRPGSDEVSVERRSIYRPGDIVLSHTPDGTVLLHRLISTTAEGATLMGDGNCSRREFCRWNDILGVAVALHRNGKLIPLPDFSRFMPRLWARCLFMRPILLKFVKK